MIIQQGHCEAQHDKDYEGPKYPSPLWVVFVRHAASTGNDDRQCSEASLSHLNELGTNLIAGAIIWQLRIAGSPAVTHEECLLCSCQQRGTGV
jgi:hypothetical protein